MVLCFGEALVDRLLPVEQNQAGGGASQHPSTVEDRLGGAPANVACGLARLGTPAAFVGCLGTDAIGDAFAALFARRGVDARGLQWDSARPSRVVLVHRHAGGERTFGGFLGDRGAGFSDQAINADELRKAAIPLMAQARWLVCGTLPLASPRTAAALEVLLAMAAPSPVRALAAGIKSADLCHPPFLAVDLNWRPTFWGMPASSAPSPMAKARIRPLLERAALLKCTAEEARWFFATEDPSAISAALPGEPAVCVTDGASTLRWQLGGIDGQLEPLAIDAVDTTGAGDAFMAGLLHGLCQPDAEPNALTRPEILFRFAAACGALVCLEAGAIDPQPTVAEVECFLKAHGQS
jgi:fructokinase